MSFTVTRSLAALALGGLSSLAMVGTAHAAPACTPDNINYPPAGGCVVDPGNSRVITVTRNADGTFNVSVTFNTPPFEAGTTVNFTLAGPLTKGDVLKLKPAAYRTPAVLTSGTEGLVALPQAGLRAALGETAQVAGASYAVGSASAKANGAVTGNLTLPAGLKSGQYLVTARGTGANGQTQALLQVVTLVFPGSGSTGAGGNGSGSGLPFTGFELGAASLLGAGLLGAGTVAVVSGRKRKSGLAA
jgi:hypothetical protein